MAEIPKYFYFVIHTVMRTDGMTVTLEDKNDADVVEVIRCKDCKWHKGNECAYEYYYDEYDSVGNSIPMYDDDFCSFGEQKDEVKE